MNTTLIPVFESTINNDVVQTVNARELHAFLGVKSKFADWIVGRIKDFGFTQDVDFTIILFPENNPGGRPTKEYHVSLDMAKELAMVERNAKGKEARQYFIAIEKAYREQQPKELTKEQILVMALESERERLRLAAELEAAKPMIEFHEEVSHGEGEFYVSQVAMMLFNGSVTEKQLFAWLRENHWMDKRKGINKPTAWAIQQGYMRLRTDVKNGFVFEVAKVTPQGMIMLRHLHRTGDLFLTGISQVRCMAQPEYRV